MWNVAKSFGGPTPNWRKGWDFYNGNGTTEEKIKDFRKQMLRWMNEILENDCAEIDVTYSEPDWAGVQDIEVTIRGVNPCA